MGEDTPERDRGGRLAMLVAALAVLLVVGAMIAIPAGILVEMSAMACREGDSRRFCDPETRRMVALLPMVALGAGLVLLAAGGAIAVRRGRSTAPWQFTAWLMLTVAVLYTWSVIRS